MAINAASSFLLKAEVLAMRLGHPDRLDQEFRLKIFSTLPDRFVEPIGLRYQKTYLDAGRREANLYLLEIKDKVSNHAVRLSSSDNEIVHFAKLRADTCRKIMLRLSSLNDAYAAICQSVKRFGIKPVKIGRKLTLYGAVMRMADDRWWRRALRKTHGRNTESIAIDLGLVRKQAGIYASDEALARRTEQKERNSKMLEEMEAINELDQSYTLKELQDLTVSNPVIRRAELMTRIAGFEEYAVTHGHVGEFVTVTCPSRMHAIMSTSGDQNPKYDGTTPNEAQAYLAKQWSKIRSSLNRAGIHIYGMRVAEPQHDGTPHWHLLIFMEPEHVQTVKSTMRHYALEVDGHEPGAQKHRFTSKAIDWSKGTAAGYIAKYISKNIDGYGVGDDLYGNNAEKSSLRVDAWASTWGIRQFQQVGGPPVTVWRYLRKLPENPDGEIASLAFQAADQGMWCQYVEAMGGHTATRDQWPIGLAKQETDRLNRYGEPIGLIAFGLETEQETYRFKSHDWIIQPKASGESHIYVGHDLFKKTPFKDSGRKWAYSEQIPLKEQPLKDSSIYESTASCDDSGQNIPEHFRNFSEIGSEKPSENFRNLSDSPLEFCQ